MTFNIWSIVLIASITQCLFLGFIYLVQKPENKRARSVFLFILLVIFIINLSNLFYASYLYRTIPGIAGSARGMTLLLGPLLYFYVQSILLPNFRFKTTHLLHLIPYVAVLTLLFATQMDVKGDSSAEMAVEAFMRGELPVEASSIIRFAVYFIHLLAYLYLARRVMNQSLKAEHDNYLVPLEQRVKWLSRLSAFLFLIAIVLIGLTVYMMVTGFYTYVGNFILTVVLSAIVYAVAYWTLLNRSALSPDFSKKYSSSGIKTEEKSVLTQRIKALFEAEKVYTNPELKLEDLAELLNTKKHLLSEVINSQMNQTFNGLLNHYRIEAFKNLVQEDKFKEYSILGLAYEVGYNSKSSFYNAFKKQMGTTPSDYLKSIKQ